MCDTLYAALQEALISFSTRAKHQRRVDNDIHASGSSS